MASSSNSLTAGSGTSAAVAELLPDPTMLPKEPSPGSADDLIASIADQQIDALISESEQLPIDKSMMDSAGAAELAVQATQELQQMAEELNAEATADLVADLNGAATEAMLTAGNTEPAPLSTPEAVIETPASTAPAEVTMPVALEPKDAAPAAAITADTEPVIAEVAEAAPQPTSAPSAPVEVVPAVGPAMTLTPADAEINQDEIDALISNSGPSPVAEPVHATSAAQDPTPHMAHAADIARSLESGAEAVAQELAADAARATSSLPPIVVVPLSAKVRQASFNTAMTVLTLVNLPIRNLSDSSREMIGIIAIVTLVNAMSMLLYLMIFR